MAGRPADLVSGRAELIKRNSATLSRATGHMCKIARAASSIQLAATGARLLRAGRADAAPELSGPKVCTTTPVLFINRRPRAASISARRLFALMELHLVSGNRSHCGRRAKVAPPIPPNERHFQTPQRSTSGSEFSSSSRPLN